ncbi:MAG: FUSC family protein, partial [Burkholderiaceae bacterium]|nr:FUSC family protein [Burkholderiaceae bacterium]
GPWGRCLLMMAMTVVVETLVVRHYAIAAVFITPLSIFLVEAAKAHPDAGPLVQARFFDTLLGSVIGMLGGVAIHHAGSRAVIRRALEWVMPARLVSLLRERE